MRRERPGHTLQTTALIHEAYIRLINSGQARETGGRGLMELDFENRSRLLGLASHVMRNLLVDHARSRAARRRGGPEQRRIPLEELRAGEVGMSDDIMAVHEALDALSAEDERSARALEGHFFGGLTIEELAAWLKVSTRTVKRDLGFAKAWIYRRLLPVAG